jgi:NADP-dependent 3-hydroxy acid dehydrogenase YdfG
MVPPTPVKGEALRHSEGNGNLAARIASAGGQAAHARTDVKRRGDLSDLVTLACTRYGKLDVLVNNAGIGLISPLDDLRVEDWDEMIDVNIKGVLYGIAAALPVFRRQGFGHVVAESMTDPEAKAQVLESRDRIAIPPDAIARAIAFAIEQPAEVDVSEVVVRPTAQG